MTKQNDKPSLTKRRFIINLLKKRLNYPVAICVSLGIIFFMFLATTALFVWAQDRAFHKSRSLTTAANIPDQDLTENDASQGQAEQSQEQPPLPPPLPERYVEVQWNKAWLKQPALPEDGEYIQRVLAGKVVKGPYAGQDLYIEIVSEMGTDYRHYVMDQDKIVYFDDQNIKITGIDDIPEEISFPNTDYKLQKGYIASSSFKDIKIVRKIFTDSKLGVFYLIKEGCLVTELPDHTAISYNFILPFLNPEDRTLSASFKDGAQNQDAYSYTKLLGCSALCDYMAQVDELTLKPGGRLKEAGQTSNSESLYELKDSNDPTLKTLYEDKNTKAYYNPDYMQSAQSEYTYAQFLSYHPLLYWKDPLGRWIEFKNTRFEVAAEMCKPVIYLYPKAVAALTVNVEPNGGFTYTQPDYNNGWQVEAAPDGSLRDLQNSNYYSYLFWEGIGLNYPEQETGFVVKRTDLDSFLSQKLAWLGLNNKEAEDFKAYWLPRLDNLNRPYYKISFLKKEQMDELAPLTITPMKPNSVIRIMMTAQGLDDYQSILEQQLPMSPRRDGFTVVEWGGTILK